MAARDYIYYDYTISLCSQCLKRIDAKVIFRNEKVYLDKRCSAHGREEVLIASDIEYYKKSRHFLKAGDLPKKFGSEVSKGCPEDCGLCTDHEQHSCLSLIEVTDRCNLKCPTCYTESGPAVGKHRSLEQIKKMMDVLVEYEGEPDVVQISGGEPTIHPQFFQILEEAKKRPFRHLMLNTNGVRLAKEKEFARELARFKPGFEIYLQFDSLQESVLKSMRGEDLREVRLKALEHLNEFSLSTTLVVTLQKGQNDEEIGELIDFALKQPCVRGITFQPTQIVGRLDHFNPATDRLTLTEVRQKILEQSPYFTAQDLIPVPCNPDALCMAYALKSEGQVIPLTRWINPEDLLNHSKNSIIFEQNSVLKEKMLKLFSTSESCETTAEDLQTMLCCLPQIQAPHLSYENVFRILIIQFLDAYNFDVRAVKRSCIHIVSEEGKIIPFDTMNLLYRKLEKKI